MYFSTFALHLRASASSADERLLNHDQGPSHFGDDVIPAVFRRGMHLIIDGYDCASALLFDRNALLRWLNDLPAKIAMSVLMPAKVLRIEHPRCRKEDEGLSGVVVICESHIAVHPWPRRGEVQADVYSCRPFDAGAVLDHFVKDFGIGSFDTEPIERRKR